MSVNSGSDNLQQIQQRLKVREQEISALKVQNRHLLSKIDEAEKNAKPNQINTQLVSHEIQGKLDPVIAQMQSTMTNSFEILQSTMRGIYQQSQRAQQAVEEMASHSRDLEIRMNEQRKADQNYYQDKIFAMMGAFCDRVERQIELRLKSLSIIEVMNSKQNEVLNEVETMREAVTSMSRNSESNRNEISRIEKNAEEANSKLIDLQLQNQGSEEILRDTLQQIQNHRSEFKLIRAELKLTLDYISRIAQKLENTNFSAPVAQEEAPPVQPLQAEAVTAVAIEEEVRSEVNEQKIIDDIIENKHRELELLEKNIEAQMQGQSQDDVAMLLALLRAQKAELQRVSDHAKNYIKDHAYRGSEGQSQNAISSLDQKDQNR